MFRLPAETVVFCRNLNNFLRLVYNRMSAECERVAFVYLNVLTARQIMPWLV